MWEVHDELRNGCLLLSQVFFLYCLVLLLLLLLLLLVSLLLSVLLHRFNGLFPGQPGQARTRKVNYSGLYWSKSCWGLGWQWHQLDHMQIICTSLQTDNHASTSPLSFYIPYALPAAQPTASKY